MLSGEHPYTFDVCTKAFSIKRSLKTHLRTHCGEHPYICDLCKKPFSERISFITHQHIRIGEWPYACAMCNKGFGAMWLPINAYILVSDLILLICVRSHSIRRALL